METLYVFSSSRSPLTMQLDTVNRRVLALIRHGDYEQPRGVPSAHLPYPLTELGRQQARQAARDSRELADREGLVIEPRIDCSRMLRAWQTADTIARELARLDSRPFHVAEFDDLAERSVGAAANLNIEQIEAVLHADPRFSVPPRGWKRDSSYKLPLQGAESLEEAGARAACHLRAQSQVTGANRLKLFVGHGGAFRHAACALGLLLPGQIPLLTMPHGGAIYLEHQLGEGVDRLVHLAGEWQPRTENSTPD